jgi:hypothetical protein
MIARGELFCHHTCIDTVVNNSNLEGVVPCEQSKQKQYKLKTIISTLKFLLQLGFHSSPSDSSSDSTMNSIFACS